MFIKQLKYDLLFGRDAFFGMGALLLGVSIIMAMVISAQEQGGAMSSVGLTIVVSVIFAITVTIASVATIGQLFSLFSKSFFGKSGYLMLTLPVTRATQIISKLTAAIIWSNYMALVAFLMLVIFAIILVDENSWNMARTMNGSWSLAHIWEFIRGYFAINTFIFMLISIVYLGITLGNSTFGRMRIHGFIAGVTSLLYFALSMWTIYRMERLFHPITPANMDLYGYATVVVFIAFGVVAVVITYHLLSKRVDLQ